MLDHISEKQNPDCLPVSNIGTETGVALKLKNNNPGRSLMLTNSTLVLRWNAAIALIALSLIALLLSIYYWLQAMPTEFFIGDLLIEHDIWSLK